MMMAKLVTIGWFTEPWEAHIAQGRLQAEDIFSCIVHEHHIWANWMYSNALGQVKLQVQEEDVERGNAIVESYWRGDFERELEAVFGPLEKMTCPACGSSQVNLHVSRFGAVLAFALYGVLGVAYPPRKNLGRCGQCSEKWGV